MVLLTCAVLPVWFALPDTQSTGALKLLQALQTLSVFLLPPLLMAYLWSDAPAQWLRMQPTPSLKVTLAAVGIMLLAMPGINLLADLNSRLVLPEFLAPLEEVMKRMEEQAAVITLRFMRTTSLAGLAVNLSVMALLPAIGEELTFRGVLFNLFSPNRSSEARVPHAAIWAVAVIFSLVHMQFYGFVPRMLLGALFGYVVCWTGSLWTSVWMHFTNNAVAVLAYFVVFRSGLNPDTLETFGTGDTLWLGIFSVLTTVLAVLLFRKKTKPNQNI